MLLEWNQSQIASSIAISHKKVAFSKSLSPLSSQIQVVSSLIMQPNKAVQYTLTLPQLLLLTLSSKITMANKVEHYISQGNRHCNYWIARAWDLVPLSKVDLYMPQSLLGSKQLLYKYIPRVQFQVILITLISILWEMEECSILGMTECHSIFNTQALWPQIE